MQSLVSFVAPTAYAQETEHSLTAATPPYGLHTKINLWSKAFLVTCFTTKTFQRSFFSFPVKISLLIYHLAHFFFALACSLQMQGGFCVAWDCLGDVICDCHDGSKTFSLPTCHFIWLEPFHWKLNHLFLKLNSITEKTFLLLALISELRKLSCCERNELIAVCVAW